MADAHDWHITGLAIQPDQVPRFNRARPYTLSCAIPRLIKGRSSHGLREEVRHVRTLPSLWTRSCLRSPDGCVSQAIIQQSIARQSKT